MWFDGKREQRILAWRQFRRSLHDWPADLTRVAAVWSKAPLGNYLTQDSADFPDPWQLIADRCFCDISVALGMFYTLAYSKYPNRHEMRLRLFNLRNQSKEFNLVECEGGKYVLNYQLGSVVNIPDFRQFGSEVANYTFKDLIR
jgi:hypothetical protein